MLGANIDSVVTIPFLSAEVLFIISSFRSLAFLRQNLSKRSEISSNLEWPWTILNYIKDWKWNSALFWFKINSLLFPLEVCTIQGCYQSTGAIPPSTNQRVFQAHHIVVNSLLWIGEFRKHYWPLNVSTPFLVWILFLSLWTGYKTRFQIIGIL